MNTEEYIDTLPKKAARLRADGTYTVLPMMHHGKLDANRLSLISRVVADNSLPGIRITAGQQVLIDGVPADRLKSVIEALGEVGLAYKHKAQGCLGTDGCKLGQQNSRAAAERLSELLDTYDMPCKVKAGVSGCPMCCAESMARDVGLYGKKGGWTVSFGGNAGKRVRCGDILGENLSEDEAFELIAKALSFYAENAKKKERTARFVERVGLDALKSAVLTAD
ncbi:nitrite reductase [uncultured Pseudodesulfovibrio sp.]|uniref:nitrite reductase n=1 Tax=uncultured Pseudodesulfovibrio sp. TaxID=2035858 RepID=UPI0029C76D4B|nr:nitrite reductase [uncultured Pseudodesulfovibrio sp.]